MSDEGSSVTLILYSIDADWWKGTEPFLNLLAAAAQRSSFTHVEVAIGEASGARGEMKNVLRVFNDSCGVELTQRTGKNPCYSYLQIGCSKKAEQAMLHWARQQVGKPFSSAGMMRSIVWPRQTTGSSYFCAELVAACLQQGGLLNISSNPGEATPFSLYKMYSKRVAVVANPCTLRREFGTSAQRSMMAPPSSTSMRLQLLSLGTAPGSQHSHAASEGHRRPTEAPYGAFKVIVPRGIDATYRPCGNGVQFSLESLKTTRR